MQRRRGDSGLNWKPQRMPEELEVVLRAVVDGLGERTLEARGETAGDAVVVVVVVSVS